MSFSRQSAAFVVRRKCEDFPLRRRDFCGLIAGALIGLPCLAGAQQPGKAYRIAFLALAPGEDARWLPLIVDRLDELGYRKGQTIEVEYRSAEGHPERIGQLAAELVALRPDVLIAGFGTIAAKAAKAATATIPVVFTTVGDPLGAGVVASLARPGGNVTGLTDQAKESAANGSNYCRRRPAGRSSFASDEPGNPLFGAGDRGNPDRGTIAGNPDQGAPGAKPG